MCVYLTEVGLSLFVAPGAALKLQGAGSQRLTVCIGCMGGYDCDFFVVCVCVYHIYSMCSSMFLVICFFIGAGLGYLGVCVLFYVFFITTSMLFLSVK